MAMAQVASPGYFATTGTRIVRGRAFGASDDMSSTLVAIVSGQFAREAWNGADPIGRCLRVGADTTPCRRVIGVAEDVRMIGDLAADPNSIYYLPAKQFDKSGGSLIVRVRGSVTERAEAIRRDLQRAMPGASYLVATPISETIAPVVRSWRVGATMFVAFGGLALVLATIGLYSVSPTRSRSAPMRWASASPSAHASGDIIALVAGDGLRLVLIGVECSESSAH